MSLAFLPDGQDFNHKKQSEQSETVLQEQINKRIK